jgi:outer membrane protein TolC
MRRFAILLAIIMAASQGFADTWDTIYNARLNGSSSYLEAKLDLKSAEVEYDEYCKPFVPSVSIATYSSSDSVYESGISFGSGTTSGGVLTPTVTFEKVFAGTDLSFKTPLSISSTNGVNLKNPSISVSRSLFPETEANRLDAEASLLSAQASVQKIQDNLKISLVTDILNTMYYQKLLETSQQNLEVLKKVRAATVDTTRFHDLDKRILSAKKSILEATKYLADIKDDVKNNMEGLYQDVTALQGKWLSSIGGDQPVTSKTIHSIELSLNAAERRGKFSILPFIPNPNLTASLYYDMDKSQLEWGLTFKISYDILNKGKNSLSSLKRTEYPKIYKIKLDDAQKELKDNLREIAAELQSLELEKEINAIEVTDSQDESTRKGNLYKSGYVSEEDYLTAQIDLETLKLAEQKIKFDILIQKLKLAKYYTEI